MARDKGLEELLNDDLQEMRGLTQKAMFGGWAWLLHGNLLLGARSGSLLVRLGRENEGWAANTPGVSPMVMRGRVMPGWMRAAPEAYGDNTLRLKLVHAAIEFTRSLPRK